jgi:chromosome segregation ATPase
LISVCFKAEKERDEAKAALAGAGGGAEDAAELVALRSKVKSLEQNKSVADPRVAALQEEVRNLKEQLETARSAHDAEVKYLLSGNLFVD